MIVAPDFNSPDYVPPHRVAPGFEHRPVSLGWLACNIRGLPTTLAKCRDCDAWLVSQELSHPDLLEVFSRTVKCTDREMRRIIRERGAP